MPIGSIRVLDRRPGSAANDASSVTSTSSPNQIKAAITQVFYTTNWLHDYWYDSGFNEGAGVAQVLNYGRGGVAGDPLHAEAQDNNARGSRNNANMSTLAEGRSPRMQMYLWSGKETRSVSSATLPPGPVSAAASFGASNFDLTAPLALAVDATVPPGDGCQPLTNTLTGKIAVIDRGACAFQLKAYNAQIAGAAGVLIVNNAPGLVPSPMGATATPAPVTIPVIGFRQEDGAILKTAIAAGATSLHMARVIGAENDGDLDNTVVAHEWGHYLHHRNVACGSTACGGQSEGWADFVALHMVVKEGDNLDGAYPLAIYASNDAYYGIRRAPYSVDPAVNALSFRHISRGQPLPTSHPVLNFGDNAEVHSSGEVWASMMHEAHIALLKESKGQNPRLTWTEAHRRMADYVVAGMQLAPEDPTTAEQRDGILAAAFTRDRKDFDVLAAAFARRGAGTGAVSPPRDSDDLIGVEESFAVAGAMSFQGGSIDDSVSSCDNDGTLDAEESGLVTFKVFNSGAAKLAATTATLSTSITGVFFPKGPTVSVPALEPYEVGTASIEIKLGATFPGVSLLPVFVTTSDPHALPTSVELSLNPRINFDDKPTSSASDDVESDTVVWTTEKAVPKVDVWSRAALNVPPSNAVNHVWYGVDAPTRSDESLKSPPLDVSASTPLVLSFSHRFSFETGPATAPVPNQPPPPDVFWDGGIIEYTVDAGATWIDLATLKDPGYGGSIGEAANTSNNPLGGHKGFISKNAAFPASEKITIDLGTALAGKTVQFRFRVASDDGTGEFGWEIDDLDFSGITNTPFATIVPDGHGCVGVPKADAGSDQTVMSGVMVTLDGGKSSDPENDPFSYSWSQVKGTNASLSTPDEVKATFVAPEVTEPTTLTFRLGVGDGAHAASATVNVIVQPLLAGAPHGGADAGAGPLPPSVTPPMTTADNGGCSCSEIADHGPAKGALVPLFGLVAAFFLRRRQRA